MSVCWLAYWSINSSITCPCTDNTNGSSKAALPVFSSRDEGQGLALVEAMACGVPAVSFDCPPGPAYIIQDQIDGILVPPEDVDSLAEAVIMLLNDNKKRLEFALAAKKARNRFSTGRICSQWENLFLPVKKLGES